MNSKEMNSIFDLNIEVDIYINDIIEIIRGNMTLEEAIEKRKNDKKINNIENDELFYKITKYIVKNNTTSILEIQKKFSISFSKASDIIKVLENKGIVSIKSDEETRKVLKNINEIKLEYEVL